MLQKREIARFAVIEVTGGKLGAVYFETHNVVEESADGESWKQIGGVGKDNVPAAVEDVAAYVGAENAALATANATLTAQNTAQQARIAELEKALSDADAALKAVAAADAAWDTSPRAEVGGAIDKIAALKAV